MAQSEKNFSLSPLLTGPTQRQITYQPSHPDISDNQWGVDTVTITFLVGKGDYDLSDGWQKSKDSYGKLTCYRRYLDYRGTYLALTIYTTGWCAVNFNAARLVHSDPLKLLDPDSLLEEIENIILFLFPFVSSYQIWQKYRDSIDLYPDWLMHVRLSRLDVAINLRNVTRANLLDLEAARVPGQNIKIIYKKTKKTTTVEIHSDTQGKDHIYDKTYQLDSKVGIKIPEQIHRFEAQLRGERLKNSVMLSKINRTRIWQVLKERWEKAGFRVIQVSKQLKDEILLEYPRIGKSIVNYLEMKSKGISPHISDPTERSYIKKIRAVQERLDKSKGPRNVLELESLIAKKK